MNPIIHKTAEVSPRAVIGKDAVIQQNACVLEGAIIGQNCTIGRNAIILENVQIGEDSYVGHNVIIHKDTKIGKNAYIDDGVVLGRIARSGSFSKRKVKSGGALNIGDNCVIGVNAVVYAGVIIGNDVLIGDLASVRENNVIGNNVIIGRLVMVEYFTKIGSNVKIQTGTHITGDSVIEDWVFFGDEVSTANDNSMGRKSADTQKGFYAKRGARIGSNATLLPGVIIGENSIVAAGAVVTKDVPDKKIVMGVPAKVIRDVPDNEII